MPSAVVRRTLEGGPATVWNAVVGRAALRRNDNYSWRLITVPEDCADIEEFYRIYSDRRIPQEVVKDAFPDHFLATTWYVSTFPSSPRWPVEAWLLAGLSVQEVAAKVSPANPVLAVDVYRRAFFSVGDEQRGNPGWMYQHLWGPGLLHRSSLFYYDMVLKVVGLHGGPELLDKVLGTGVLPADSAQRLRELALDLRDRMVLTDLNVRNTLSGEDRSPLVESTLSEWRNSAPPRTAANPALTALAQAIKKEMGILTPGTDTEASYEFLSQKYEDNNE